MRTLVAKDGSKNFIWDRGSKEALEARYVVRKKGELICYLSSQTGCARSCRMCHLTQTGQVKAENAAVMDFRIQVKTVLNEVNRDEFHTVSYNFMARGEPLDNPRVNSTLLGGLAGFAEEKDLIPRFKISTIMPKDADLDLIRRFPTIQPDIYYSFYSTRPSFRSRWFPKAEDYNVALERLNEWQDWSHKIPRIHLALIKGENDGIADLYDLVETIQSTGLRVDFNIVRYNPYDDSSMEGDWEQARDIFTDMMPESKVQVVQRVGLEAFASCGMFVS